MRSIGILEALETAVLHAETGRVPTGRTLEEMRTTWIRELLKGEKKNKQKRDRRGTTP